MTQLKTILPIAALLLATTAFVPAARAEDTTTTTTTYHSQSNYSTTAYNWYPTAGNAYVSGQIGWEDPNGNFDNSAVYSLALGWQANEWLRTELEASYRDPDIDVGPGDANIWAFLLNGYWDFKNDSIVTPYLGAGIGYAHENLDGTAADDNSGAFAWKGIAGVSFDVAPNIALTAEYNYFDTSNFDYHANEFKGGVRFKF